MSITSSLPTDSQHKLTLLRQIGNYRLFDLLRSDALGDYYRALHLDEKVAEDQGDVEVIVFSPSAALDQGVIQRYRRAVAHGQEFTHPSIVKVHEFVSQGETAYLVREQISGQSLYQLLSSIEFTVQHVIRLLAPVARALDALHQQGGVHLQINPRNILLEANGQPKIAGFGSFHGVDEATLRESKDKIYRAAYMAPEQFNNWHMSPDADRYAFGMLFYELCTGAYPWRSQLNNVHVLMHKRQGKLIPAHQRCDKFNLAQSKIVMDMLAVRPDKRLSSCFAFLDTVWSAREGSEKPEEEAEDAEIVAQKKREKQGMAHRLSVLNEQLSEHKKQLDKLVKERDKGFANLESRYETFYTAVEQELRAIKMGIEQAEKELEDSFESKRQQKYRLLARLEADVTQCQQRHEKLREQLQAAESNSVFSFLPGSKGTKLRKRYKAAEAQLQEAIDILRENQKSIDMELADLKEKQQQAGDKLAVISQEKLKVAEERAQQRLQQARQQFKSTRSKFKAQYKTSRADLDKQLRHLQKQKDDLYGRISILDATRQHHKDHKEMQVRRFADIEVAFLLFSPERYYRGAAEDDERAAKNELPRHQVNLINSFWVSTTVVTQQLYQQMMDKNPSQFRGPMHPVESVTWFQAIAFCNKLSLLAGYQPVYVIDEKSQQVQWNREARGYRLPSEAEWELMSGNCILSENGAETRKTVIDRLSRAAWYKVNSSNGTQKVGLKQANRFGLYDMIGNVWEWCWDWYGQYPQGLAVDPIGPATGTRRVRRGGSWKTQINQLRNTYRSYTDPNSKTAAVGFRVVCDLQLQDDTSQ